MLNLSSDALDAATRALCGESNVGVVEAALYEGQLARVIALAPDAHPVIRAVAALFGNAPALLDPQIIDNPAFYNAVAWIIGTSREGEYALASLATVVPAGWGSVYEDALVDAARKKRCHSDVAAALIGPCNTSASLLGLHNDIAFAIRCWGQATPETPTAWMHAISTQEQGRLLALVQRSPSAMVQCLPWLPLPPNAAFEATVVKGNIGVALNAFAEASPMARAQHADILHLLVAHAHLSELEPLTRLACAMGSKEVWDRVHALVQAYPFAADRVVIAARWEAIAETVRSAILDMTDQYDICEAIAAARGRAVVTAITDGAPIAFFAALDPKVWDTLPSDEQRRWLHELWETHAYLAVRSLGLRPDILARAEMNDNLVHAAKRHARDAAALRWALFPVALRSIPPDEAHTLIAALPTTPPDPSAFFGIVSKRGVLDGRASARTAPTPADLACAVALQRSVVRYDKICARSNALRAALRGRRWDDLAPLLALLDADARAALMPDSDALIARLAHPDRREEMRAALSRLASLPPEVDIPVRFALSRWITECANAQEGDASAADAIADILHASGDVFLELKESIADDVLCDALLPLPKEAALADALRDLACDDPPTAHNLAHALRGRSWRDTVRWLLATPQRHADNVWRALDDAARSRMVAEVATMPSDADPIVIRDPIAGLALAAVQSSDADMREAGFAALAARADVLRAVWETLPQATQQSLRIHPSTALSVADLPQTHDPAADRRIRRR